VFTDIGLLYHVDWLMLTTTKEESVKESEWKYKSTQAIAIQTSITFPAGNKRNINSGNLDMQYSMSMC